MLHSSREKMEIRFKSRIYLILLIALIIRFLFIFAHQEVNLRNEMKSYDKAALSLRDGEGFKPGGPGNREMHSLIPPGYSIFLAFIYWLFGHSFLAARIVQAIISTGSVYLLYKIAQFSFEEKESILATWIMALYPQNLIMADLLLTETWFMFLLLLGVLFLITGIEKGSWGALIISGFVFGVSILTRSILFLFIPFLMFFVICIRRSIRDFIHLLIVFFCIILT